MGQSRGLSGLLESFSVYFVCVFSCMLWLICLFRLDSVISPQAMLMRQQDRLEGRVQNIDEQLNKLESDKTLMKVARTKITLYMLTETQH